MRHVLSLNGGSSSIKFAVHRLDAALSRRLSGGGERRPRLRHHDGFYALQRSGDEHAQRRSRSRRALAFACARQARRGARARICAPLQFLGIEVDAPANRRHARVISTTDSRVSVLVLPTDEEWMMAQQCCALLNLTANAKESS